MQKFLILLIALFCTNVVAQEKEVDQKVLGVKFGDSYKSISKKVKLKSEKPTGAFKSYTAEKMPKGLSDGSVYILLFYKKRLVKVDVIGVPYVDDTYGVQGKAAYEKYKKILASKYTQLNSYERMFEYVYTEPHEFWECLGYKGSSCGVFMTIFEGDGRTILLELKGMRSSGYYHLSIEGAGFTAAMNEHNEKTKAKDENAL